MLFRSVVADAVVQNPELIIPATIEAAAKNPEIIGMLASGLASHPELIGTAIGAAINAILKGLPTPAR